MHASTCSLVRMGTPCPRGRSGPWLSAITLARDCSGRDDELGLVDCRNLRGTAAAFGVSGTRFSGFTVFRLR